MTLSQHDQARVDDFFSEIAGFADAYRHPSLRYLLLRNKDEWSLLQGVVALNTHVPISPDQFETSDVVAGEIPLSDLAASAKDFLGMLLKGKFEIAGRTAIFPPEQSGSYSTYNRPFDGSVLPPDRTGQLTINGTRNFHYLPNEAPIIRQLKSSLYAFSSISELAKHYRMDFPPGSGIHVDFYAPRVAEVTDRSRIALGNVSIELWLAGTLDPKKAQLRLNGIARDGQNVRLPAPDIQWSRNEQGDWTGEIELGFADGKAVDCTLVYADFVQQKTSIEEPPALGDTLRFVYEQLDPQSSALKRVINDSRIKNRDGRELEIAVAAMLSLSGFRLLSLDRVPELEEAPDIVAADPRGNLLIVECTLSVPNAADKMGKLFRRHHTIREQLDRAGLDRVQTVPLLALTLPGDKISSYLNDATKADVLMWGRERLHDLREDCARMSASELFDKISLEHRQIGLLHPLGQ